MAATESSPSSDGSCLSEPKSRAVFAPIPLPESAREVNFGVQVTGLDLAALRDDEFADLRRALYEHHVVVVRDQGHVTPQEQLAITRRFDADAAGEYGHGSNLALMKAGVLSNDLLLGCGRVAEHNGLTDIMLKHPMHFTFHKDPLPGGEALLTDPHGESPSETRFYRWHIDAALYGKNPPMATTLMGLVVPTGGRTQTIRYDDGSGELLEVPLATTAFISGEYAFESLAPDAKAFALRCSVRYHAHPYIWIKNCRALPTGLGLESEGREVPDAELPEWSEEKVCVFPAVWRNPVTGKLALQIHPCCVEDLLVDGAPLATVLRALETGEGADERFAPVRDGSQLPAVRRVLTALLRPGIAPSRVLAHDWAPGDFVIFNNRAVLHTVTGSLRSHAPEDLRIFHQCNIAGSTPPAPATPDDVAAVLAAAGVSDAAASATEFLRRVLV